MVNDKRLNDSFRLLVLGLYAGSGLTALIYQMLWTRYFKLVFGSTSLAVTTIVSTFMVGLALGSYFFGKRADTSPRPLRLYGIMEMGIGVYALIFPVLYLLLESLYLQLSFFEGGGFLARSLLRFVLSVVFLIFPTFLMGGTFPVVCRFYLQKVQDSGIWVGRLYALNTLGGVIGVISGGLFFPVWFGIRDSLLLGGLLNVLVGFLAVSISRRIEWPEPAEDMPEETGGTQRQALPRLFWLLSLALLMSGLTALSYEILWIRILGIILGSSIYAFTLILAIYLSGLALGSWLYATLFGRRMVNVFLFAMIELLIGFLAILTFPLVNELPYWVARYITPLNFSFWVTQSLHAGLIAILILFATLVMGATIPCAIHIISRDFKDMGKKIGTLYGLNTVGAIMGAFATGFFLIPFLGIKPSFLLMAVINMGIGLAVVLAASSAAKQRLIYVSCAVAFSFLLFSIPAISHHGLTSGVFLYAYRYRHRLYNREVFQHTRERDKLIFYRDGLSSTVTVLESPTNRLLTVNGKIDASNIATDMSTQILLAYLPLMLHSNPREVLVIGLGSGITLSSTLDFPVNRVTQVEIEAAVVEAAHYFEAENRGDLTNPKVEIIIEDGRNYLLSHPRQFDVIISEPSNPWMAGVANLFSAEHFTLLRDRLAAGGIACQWLHLYSLRPEDVRMVMRTFHSVFPNVHIFQSSPGDIILIGFKNQLSLDLDRIESLFEKNSSMVKRLQRIKLYDPLVLLEWSYRMDSEGVASFAGEGEKIHTDDRPFLELSAPRSLHESYERGILQQFSSLSSSSLVEGYLSGPEALGRHYLGTARACFFYKDPVRGNSYFQKAVEKIREDPEIQLELAKIDFRERKVYSAVERTEAILKRHPERREAAFYLAELYLGQGHHKKVAPLLEELLKGSDAAAVWARLRLAESEKEPEKQLEWLTRAYQMDANALEVLLALANYYRAQGDPSMETEYLKRLIAAHPNYHPGYVRLGELAFQGKDLQSAKNLLLTAIAIQPVDPSAHFWLAKVYLALDEPSRAHLEYLKSLSFQ
ncbi:MAG: fused MFS/spermidine synthase [Candidatus Binatia bacterium]